MHRARSSVEVPEICPVTVPAGPQRTPIDAEPVIDLGADRPPVGFDAPFAITRRARLRAARARTDQLATARGRAGVRAVDHARMVSSCARARRASRRCIRNRRRRASSRSHRARRAGSCSRRSGAGRTRRRSGARSQSSRPRAPQGYRASRCLSSCCSRAQAGTCESRRKLGHAQVHARRRALGVHARCARSLGARARRPLRSSCKRLWHDKTPYDCGRPNATRPSPRRRARAR